LRIYIDACIDPKVAELFTDHDVSTAFELRWHRLLDREIVARCNGKFDVLLTIDRGFEYEHNLSKLQFGIVIVHVLKNKVAFYRPLRENILAAVDGVAAGRVVHIR
jgi:predicted nuclease of predicted toxin-antitoxin system